MYLLEIVLLVAGIVLLAIGYRRNLRNLLLAGAVVLFLSAALGSFVEGYIEGYSQSRSSH